MDSSNLRPKRRLSATCDNGGVVNQVRQHGDDVAERILSLALAEPPGTNPTRTMLAIRDYARELLDDGYSGESLLNDFERAVETVRQRSSDDEAEDPILDVMDFLVGWCSPGARL